MENGNRGKRRKLLSSSLLSPFCVLLCLFFLIIVVAPLSATDNNKPIVGLSSGILIDIAPYGVEQIYFTAQGLYTSPGAVALSIRPSISTANSLKMFRIPLVIILSGYIGRKEFVLISGYLGGGLEIFRSSQHNAESFLITGGISIGAGVFYIDIPMVRAYRFYNTDSDIAITAGLFFKY